MTERTWDGAERREINQAFDVRSQLLSEINKAEDKSMRTVLLLMFGILEQSNQTASRVERKIDNFFNDADRLRRIVLDIHEPVHRKHHEFMAEEIRKAEDLRKDKRSIMRSLIGEVLKQIVAVMLGAIGTAIALINYLPK